jgi:hypothetical protein
MDVFSHISRRWYERWSVQGPPWPGLVTLELRGANSMSMQEINRITYLKPTGSKKDSNSEILMDSGGHGVCVWRVRRRGWGQIQAILSHCSLFWCASVCRAPGFMSPAADPTPGPQERGRNCFQVKFSYVGISEDSGSSCCSSGTACETKECIGKW